MTSSSHRRIVKKRPSHPPLSVQQQLSLLNLIFDHIDNGACVVDPEGFITHFNKPYGKFLGVDPQQQIGRHITEVVAHTRMHIVAKTGKAEINASQPIQGQNMIVQRIPVKVDGKVIAVYGQVMFKDVKEVSMLAAKLSELQTKVRYYEKELQSLRTTKYSFDSIKTSSKSLLQLLTEAKRISQNQLPVLISGESGTGKELFAQAIHQGSKRQKGPFIRLNCAAIPKDLLEAELFGYVKGAFTGATSEGKAGKFELANNGSIFLDEIGDLPFEMQPKLLRVLEERELERIGGNKIIKTNFRLITATNQDLEKKVKNGSFRADLFYRLNVVPLEIPPLRKRKSDIIYLAQHLIGEYCIDNNTTVKELTPEAQSLLQNHNWPGNVRELSNVLARTVSAVDGALILPNDLPLYLHKGTTVLPIDGPSLLKDVVAKAEKNAILEALKLTGYNKARAAEILGIHRTLLYKKARKYSIELSQAKFRSN